MHRVCNGRPAMRYGSLVVQRIMTELIHIMMVPANRQPLYVPDASTLAALARLVVVPDMSERVG